LKGSLDMPWFGIGSGEVVEPGCSKHQSFRIGDRRSRLLRMTYCEPRKTTPDKQSERLTHGGTISVYLHNDKATVGLKRLTESFLKLRSIGAADTGAGAVFQHRFKFAVRDWFQLQNALDVDER
jgi:hypothetical protein